MPTPANVEKLRVSLRTWLDAPLRIRAFDGVLPGETYSSQVLRGTFAAYLPKGIQRVTNRDVLAIVMANLENQAAWADMTEHVDLTQGLLPEDPADVAADCDKAVVMFKNFKAFVASLTALAGDGPLSHAEMERRLRDLRSGPDLLRDAVAAFTFEKPDTQWSLYEQIMAGVLTSSARWFSQTVATHLDGNRRGRS